MKELNSIAILLLVAGGLNWGLVGLWDTNLLANILGEGTMLLQVAYVLIGASALYYIYNSYFAKKRR